jgi:hypothetical protein
MYGCAEPFDSPEYSFEIKWNGSRALAAVETAGWRLSEAFFANKKGELIAGMIDFNWVIDAGPFGKQTVQGIDAWLAYSSKGKGDTDNPKVETTTNVRMLERFRE